MPYALCIELDRERAPWLPLDCTDALHAQVFGWLKQVDATQAEHLHERGHTSGLPPFGDPAPTAVTRFPAFTVASANTDVPERRARGGRRADSYFISFLPDNPDLFAQLCAGIESARLQLNRGVYWVEVNGRVAPMLAEPRVVAERRYDDLFTNAHDERRIRLRFTTPTFFSTGKKDQQVFQRLPDPVRVFRGYADRWNAFVPAGQQFDAVCFASWVEQAVEITDMRLHVQRQVLKRHVDDMSHNRESGRDPSKGGPGPSKDHLSRPRGPFEAVRPVLGAGLGHEHNTHVGFVGEVEYGLARYVNNNMNAEARMGVHWLNVLADFAEFCGTGRMAAQGFGQTWRIVDLDG